MLSGMADSALTLTARARWLTSTSYWIHVGEKEEKEERGSGDVWQEVIRLTGGEGDLDPDSLNIEIIALAGVQCDKAGCQCRSAGWWSARSALVLTAR